MDGKRRQIVGQAGRGRWEVLLELADQGTQTALGVLRARGSIERRPVGPSDPLMEQRLSGQLGQNVAQAMDRTALPVGVGPELADRPNEPGCPVRDDQERAREAARDEAMSEIEPVFYPLALTQTDVEQDPIAFERVAPGEENAPSGTKTRSCGPRVLVDEPAEEISPFDFGRTVGLSTGARLSVA
jgi:hypothetical protein